MGRAHETSTAFPSGLSALIRIVVVLCGDTGTADRVISQAFTRVRIDLDPPADVNRTLTWVLAWSVRAYLSEGLTIGAPVARDVDDPPPSTPGSPTPGDVLAKVSKLARVVLLLRYGVDLSVAKIASTVGSTPNAIAGYLDRLLRHISGQRDVAAVEYELRVAVQRALADADTETLSSVLRAVEARLATPDIARAHRRTPRSSRAKLLGGAAALAAVGLVVGVLVAVTHPTGEGHAEGAVTWRSGAYPGAGFDKTAAERFAAYRDRPLGVVTAFIDWKNWSDVFYSKWLFERYAGLTAPMAIALPLTVRGTPLEAVAAGSDDWAFRHFAQIALESGRGNSDIRLGWEFNEPTFPWFADNAAAYLAAFRHVSTLLKGLLPHATIDWNGDWSKGKTNLNPFTQLYPGDAYVDVVGMDAYDHGNVAADTPRTFAAWAAAPFGLNDWAAFAALHHKLFAVPEWGLTASGGGDNPAFIRGMFHWFAAHARLLDYEAYFNEPAGGGHAHNSLTDPVEMPASSATYRRLWQL